jgi:hypothetical protein
MLTMTKYTQKDKRHARPTLDFPTGGGSLLKKTSKHQGLIQLMVVPLA